METFDLLTAFSILEEGYNLEDKSPELLQLIILKEFETTVTIEEIKRNYELFKKKC